MARRALRRFGLLFAAAFAPCFFSACLPRGDAPPRKLTEDDAGSPRLDVKSGDSTITPTKTSLASEDPHALEGIEPPHGSFAGGQLAKVRGRGFTREARIWFGTQEVDSASVVAVDGGRLQVTVPPGTPGTVSLTTQNGDDSSTRRTLADAYEYDALAVSPALGATSGGTEITVTGAETNFGPGTEVTLGGQPCSSITIRSATELSCITPTGTPGVQSIRVSGATDAPITLLDAFTFSNTDNGFRGGLSGGPLGDQLTVVALDVYTGSWIPGAWVILGDDIGSAKRTDKNGVAVFQSLASGTKPTVTVAQKCYQPITLAEVPVDRVTVYLDPVLSPDCGDLGDLPGSGGSGVRRRTVRGELLWPSSTREFSRDGWTNVPTPHYPGDEQVAYVFPASSTPDRRFQLPSASSAVTPSSSGTTGFAFELQSGPTNLSLYALAGIENRTTSPARFIPYSMGLVRGVMVTPDEDTESVFIRMDVPLDHSLSVEITAPQPTSRGPDRVRADLSVKINDKSYLSLPAGTQTKLLPLTAPVNFVGLPPLSGPLAGAQYVVTARAVTGASEGEPSSVLGLFGNSAQLPNFVELPVLLQPQKSGLWDGRKLSVSWAPGGAPVDLSVIQIKSGGDLISWTVALPSGVQDVTLPNLAALSAEASLIPGPVTLVVNAAQIEDFNYGSLRYRQLTQSGWNAYATDSITARYVPAAR